MKKAIRRDKELVAKIIEEAYADNPSVVWVLRNDRFFRYRLRVLSRYCFEKGLANDGLYISSDQQGISIFYRLEKERNNFRSFYREMLLVLLGIGLFRLPGVMKRDTMIRRMREPKSGLYFWMFAVKSKHRGGGSAKEMSDFAFRLAEENKWTVLAETSVMQNKRVYERFGFETYSEWIDQRKGMTTWLMRKSVSPKEERS